VLDVLHVSQVCPLEIQAKLTNLQVQVTKVILNDNTANAVSCNNASGLQMDIGETDIHQSMMLG
jgi:hypothetical protein